METLPRQSHPLSCFALVSTDPHIICVAVSSCADAADRTYRFVVCCFKCVGGDSVCHGSHA
jgi:flavin reductase (DIM6/NTAB) family NADH-FMN oxidoreductase RutF